MEKQRIVTVIADNVRALMKQQGLSSIGLAKKCGISTGTISKIIHGNMSITVPMLVTLTEGLNVQTHDILEGLIGKKTAKVKLNKNELLFIGVLSINNKRLTCVKDYAGKIIGTSELEGGLDIAESLPGVLHRIQQATENALLNNKHNRLNLRHASLTVVAQSYEFEETRNKFEAYAKKYFREVKLVPDWQITHLATFKNSPGISLVIDKGVSLSYLHDGKLKKLGGWKFPIYDLGGENWLGLETLRHAIEAHEGYIPMSSLAHTLLTKFNNSIEKITETCFKGARDRDVYSSFSDILLRCYFAGDKAAKGILEHGFELIYRAINKVDAVLEAKYKIALNGSLANVYKDFFTGDRLIFSPSDTKKVKLLADMAKNMYSSEALYL